MPLRYGSVRRDSTSGSECSENSDHSRSTAPTVYSHRPALRHYETDISQWKAERRWQEASFGDSVDSRASVESYPSTVASEADLDEEYPVFEEPLEYLYESPHTPAAYPTTPLDFAEYFPSTQRLGIRHDDTIDGNMNLRIDTEAQTENGRRIDLTLFHLRMHDLKNREFSLRRYCRDSGREVCHSSRKYTKPASERRPGLQRSMSNALASLKSKSDSRTSTKTSLKRMDSGYDSMSEDGNDFGSRDSFKSTNPSNLPIPTNTINLEFANYAHVDLKRRGAKSSKRYEFSYWGTNYVWNRVVRKDGASRRISYHLHKAESSFPIAYIVPSPMTPTEAQEEEDKGGWVPPSSMRISDPKVFEGLTDVAE